MKEKRQKCGEDMKLTGKQVKSGKRSKKFDVVAAVKSNARTVIGQPKPARVLSGKTLERQGLEHKLSLAEKLAGDVSNV